MAINIIKLFTLNIQKLLKTRYSVFKQFLFISKINFIKTENENLKKLVNDGFVHIKSGFPKKNIKEILDKNHDRIKSLDVNCINESLELDTTDKNNIFSCLNDLKILDICKEYLGKNLITYSNIYNLLGNKKSSKKSWQPHHDSKMNRLKIYIWISPQNYMTHPLFYLKGSHKKIKSWIKTEETRFPDEKSIFEKIYGDVGDIIIFDTHGIHSHFKTTDVPRESFILTLESHGIFNRVNMKTKKGEKELKRLNGEIFNY